MNKCLKCGRVLTSDEVALHKKVVNRGATSHMCIDCCAEYFNVTVQLLEEKIIQFKEAGCALFEENTP